MAAMPGGSTARYLILGTAWSGNGGHTVNRELAAGLARLGHHVTLRVVGPVGTLSASVDVQSLTPIPGIDARGQLLRADGLPQDVDTVVGAGRFSGGAAGYLRDQHYPGARVVHFVHAAVDELDRWRGDPTQANAHGRTERLLIDRADLAVGVGPLLAEEARQLARMGERNPPVHELVAGTTLRPPPHRSPAHTRLNVLLFGRADDPLKGADIAAHAVGELHRRGLDVRLTVRGGNAHNAQALADQENRLSTLAGTTVKVRGFTDDQAELDSDLRGADMVVIPSRQDGFPLTAMEAAGYGIPILVGSNIGTGMFLTDPSRVPTELGRPSVVPMKGNEPAPDLGHTWADHAEELLRDLDRTRTRAMRLRDHLGASYTWEHAAARLHERVQEISPTADRTSHTPSLAEAGPTTTTSPTRGRSRLARITSILVPETTRPATPRTAPGSAPPPPPPTPDDLPPQLG
ncbi:glycosyltransferase family 4 protein [Embleya sp. NPDC056575]|uniref:glycosyltransferase family 4 protein n=1 Tax=unclassified Embleya TaxID=2699296 RepID=UPI0036B604FB